MSKDSSSHDVVSSGLKLFSSQLIQNVFLLGFGVYFAHVLSKEEMAVVSLFFLLTTLTPAIASFGLIDYLLRKVPEYLSEKRKSEAKSLIQSIFIVQLIVTILVAAAIIVFAEDLSELFLKTDSYSLQIKIIGLGALMQSLYIFFDAVIRSMQLFGKLAKAKIMANVVSRIFAFVFFFFMGLNGYLSGLLLGIFITIIMMIYYSWDILSIKAAETVDYKFLIKFSFPYYMSNITRYLLMNVDKYIIGLFLTPAHLATYFIASKIVEYLKQIIDALLNPVFPKIAEFKAGNIERIERAFLKSSRYMAMLFIPLSIGGATLSYTLLYLYGGIKYTDGTVLLAILFISMIGYSYTGLFGINIHIMGKPVDKLKIDLTGGILSIILSVISVYFFQDTGVAVAKFWAFIGSVIIGYIILNKIFTVKFDVSATWRSFSASLVMAAFIILPQIYFDELRIIPVHTIVGIVAFFFIMIPKFNQSDRDLVGSFLPQRLKWIIKS